MYNCKSNSEAEPGNVLVLNLRKLNGGGDCKR